MGRAATELALQLLGGGHRLNPTNMHQVKIKTKKVKSLREKKLKKQPQTESYQHASGEHLPTLWISCIFYQVPMAVFLCGVNTVGTLGLAAARHLASHGVSFAEQFATQTGWF